MAKDLKRASISGVTYRFLERFLAQLVTMIVTVVLARILSPETYGITSLITVFITICNVLVSDGLSSSLIQKKDSDELDFSTVCWTSVAASVVLYLIIFMASPIIAEYYNNELISPVLRVMSLRIPLAAFNSVQSAYVSKNLLFKKFFYATLIGTITSGFVGVVMALCGCGVWSLAAQYLTNSLMDTIFLFVRIDWKPKFQFSFERLKQLFGFGFRILVSSLINELYEEMRSLIIAKQYSTTDLSFFAKGKSFPQIIGNNITSTITNVMFPVYSTIQDDKKRLKSMVRRTMSIGCYILCPLMIGFSVVAESFVTLVLTEKWLGAVPFIQIFSLMFIFKPLKNINRSALKALKRSDIDLKINSIEKALGICLVVVFLKRGTIYLALTALATYVFGVIVYAIVIGRLLNYHFIEQIKDIIPFFALACISCVPAYCLNNLEINTWIKLFCQITSASVIYLGVSALFKISSYYYILDTLRSFLKRKK